MNTCPRPASPHCYRSHLRPIRLLALPLLIITLTGPWLSRPVAATRATAPAASHGHSSLSAPATGSEAQKLLVDADDSATLQELGRLGAVLLVDYGTFALWSVPADQSARLSAQSGSPLRDDLDTIWLRNGPLDTRAAPPAVPAHLQQQRLPGGQFWMVQFVGPIKDAWIDQLRAIGLELVAFLPSNAYVVWGDENNLAQLDALAASSTVIQWSGPYHPSYRLDTALQERSVQLAADALVDVTVQFYITPGLSQSLSRLREIGGAILMQPANVLQFSTISLQLPASQLAAVAAWPDVYNIEPWAAPEQHDEMQGQILANNLTTDEDGQVGPSGPGYLEWLAEQGFPTSPENYPVVAVVDDGLDTGDADAILHPDFYEQGNPAGRDRVTSIVNCTVDERGNGLESHGTINAGIVAGYNDRSGFPYEDEAGYQVGLGISPYGRIAAIKNFNNAAYFDVSRCGGSDQGLIEASFEAGAAITTNSWGANVGGQYTAASQAYDAATRDASSTRAGNQEMLHIFSAGNAGSSSYTVGAPATAKNVLAVGATESTRDNGIIDGCAIAESNNADDVADFSSRGPTADERSKPDIMAPGVHIQGPASQDPGFVGGGVCGGIDSGYYPDGQTLYTWSSGTSHSAPAVAGAASLLYEYYSRMLAPGQSPSPAMLKALLLNTARYLSGPGAEDTLPSPQQGWGDVNLAMLFDETPRSLLDQSIVLHETGEEYVTSRVIADTSKPLRVSLVWTDAPGSTTSSAYVNDLDLQVVADGVSYRGNNFGGAFSDDGGAFGAYDWRNNVESVFLPPGVGDVFAVRVIARNLAGDGIPGNADLTDQDFALVIYNDSAGFESQGNVSGSVTSAATGEPIAGALVQASLSQTRTISARTGPDGRYTLMLPAGNYTFHTSAYGYVTRQSPNVAVREGQTTSVNAVLQTSPMVLVQGSVRDGAGAGYPLYARIHITAQGYSKTILTDPLTGNYSIMLAQDTGHTFVVEAVETSQHPQPYHAETRQIIPQAVGNIYLFTLRVNEEACAAAGYYVPHILFEDFEGGSGGFTTNWTSAWEWGTPTGGPGEAHSGQGVWAVGLAGSYPHNEDSTITSPALDLSAYQGQRFVLSWWQWLSTEPYHDKLRVEASSDDGATWNLVYGPVSGDSEQRWTQQMVTLGTEYATSSVRIRFRFQSDYSVIYDGYYLDDVGIAIMPTSVPYAEDFEADDGGYTRSGSATSWGWGQPDSGPGQAHSGHNVWATNLNGHYRNNENGTITSPPIDLSSYAGQSFWLSWWQWLWLEYGYDRAVVEISSDDGQTWNGLLEGSGDLVWTRYEVKLGPEYATPHVRLRFRFESDYLIHYPGFYIDDIRIESARWPCEPQAGGLVVGRVYDNNTGQGIAGARVASDQDATTSTSIVYRGETLAEGYYSLFLPAGEHILTAAMDDGYATITQTVAVAAAAVQQQDFALAAAALRYTGPPLDVKLAMGESITLPLEIANSGTLSASFTLQRVASGYLPADRQHPDVVAGVLVPGFQPAGGSEGSSYAGERRVSRSAWQYQPAPQRLYQQDSVDVLLLAAASVEELHTMLEAYPDIGQVGVIDARQTTPTLAELRSYDVVIVLTDETFADPAAVGDLLADYVDAGGKLIQTAPTFFDADGTGWGLQGRFASQGYSPFIGHGDHMRVASLGRFDAQHPIMEGVSRASDSLRQVVDVRPEAEVIAHWSDDEFVAARGGVVALNAYFADGFAWQGDVDTILYNSVRWLFSLNNASWFRVAPAQGELAAGATHPLSLTVQADVAPITRPGNYLGQVRVMNDTPYPTLSIPITMSVEIPASWGRLTGVVSSTDSCHNSTAPLPDARLYIESLSTGASWTISTDSEGAYELWLDERHSPLQITLTHSDHISQTLSGVAVVAGGTTTQHVALRQVQGCLDSIALSGPHESPVGAACNFTVVATPTLATLPITYTWEATEHQPLNHTQGLSDTVAYVWNTTGSKTIIVHADNGSGQTVVATHNVYIYQPFVRREPLYLPLIRR